MLKKLFHRKWVTPLMVAVCLIPFITGALMFFGYKSSVIKMSHEWVGMAMVVIGIAHILSHWSSFKMYLKEKRVWWMSALCILVIPSYFAFVSPLLSSENDKISPRYFIQLISKTDIETFAALSQQDTEILKQKLMQENLKIDDFQKTLGAIAKENDKSLFDLIAIVQ